MTSLADAEQRLRKVWLFAEIEAASLRSLAATANTRRVVRGEVVVEQGAGDGDLYVVVRGLYKVSMRTRDGKETALNVLGVGDLFGDLALLDGLPRSATVSALGPGELMVVRRPEFLRVLHSCPDATEKLLQRLSGLVRKLSDSAEERSSLGIGERLARRLLDLSQRCGAVIGPNQVALPVRLSQTELGQLVQATRESVNKWLGSWARQGIVYRTHEQIIIRDRLRLAALSQPVQTDELPLSAGPELSPPPPRKRRRERARVGAPS